MKENANKMLKVPLPIHLVHEWHPSKNSQLVAPQEFTGSRNQKIWWQCSKNPFHQWEAIIANRVRGSGCPYCANRKTNQENCLQATHPKLASEWHESKNIKLKHPKTQEPLTPMIITSGSAIRVWWQCDYGHEWESTVDSRHRAKNGCPYCSGKRVCSDNSLFSKNPELASEWHPSKNENLTPMDVTSGSKKEAWWICAKNNEHEWKASIDSRNRGNGCPICAGQKVHLLNCLATVNPKLASEWHPSKNGDTTPFDFTPGSKKVKIWWSCSKGHEWQALILTRSHGHGCPECSRKVKSETATQRWIKYREKKENEFPV